MYLEPSEYPPLLIFPMLFLRTLDFSPGHQLSLLHPVFVFSVALADD